MGFIAIDASPQVLLSFQGSFDDTTGFLLESFHQVIHEQDIWDPVIMVYPAITFQASFQNDMVRIECLCTLYSFHELGRAIIRVHAACLLAYFHQSRRIVVVCCPDNIVVAQNIHWKFDGIDSLFA